MSQRLYVNNAETGIVDSIDKLLITLTDTDKFVAYVNIDDLLKLLMDNRFYEALKRYEETKNAQISL